jgi:mitogen-activated protein kinase 15
VLLNSDCHVRLCDFGLARSIADVEDTKSMRCCHCHCHYHVTSLFCIWCLPPNDNLMVAMACGNIEGEPVLTDYVATRWYRAPEILLGSTK